MAPNKLEQQQEVGSRGILSAALEYASRGWPVLPIYAPFKNGCSCFRKNCSSVGKHPRIKRGWKDASTDQDQIRRWFCEGPPKNLAIVTGQISGLLVLDVDGAQGAESLRKLEDEFGPLPKTAIVRTGNGLHYYFQCPSEAVRCSAGNLGPGLDIRADGGYIIAPPSIHPSGRTYAWKLGQSPEDIPLAAMPEWVLSLASHGNHSSDGQSKTRIVQNGRIPKHQRNVILTSLCGTMRQRGMGEKAMLSALLEENDEKCQEPLDEDEIKRIVRSIARYDPKANRFALTDAGNAELFVSQYAQKVRFDHPHKTWMIYQEHWWVPDHCDEVIQYAKNSARMRYILAQLDKDLDERKREAIFALNSESRNRIEATLKIARSEPALAVSSETQWNPDPWFLGVGNGVVDLKTGALRRGKPEDLITIHTPIPFDPSAKCPRWRQFIKEIFDNNKELIDYIWKAAGYSLSGDVSEQCFHLLHGLGANGKSKFLGILRYVLGGYAYNAPFTIFERRQRSAIPNDLAALVGRRLVTASETNEYSVLNESRIKMLTGGDDVTARFLHQEFFTYRPVLKLWLSVNHRPRVTDLSHGFWRRVRLIPFQVRFEGPRDDKQLDEKLRAETKGVLAWLVEGCLAYRQRGLDPPAIVLAATEDYRAESDPLREFIAARCVEDPRSKVGAAKFYDAYRVWAAFNGIHSRELLDSRSFGEKMKERIQHKRTNTGIFYLGIRLRESGKG